MATILKAPSLKDGSKGVVVFTTQDRDNFIVGNSKLENRIQNLKKDWLIGLHHNWHDHKFEYNPIFDFSFAGEGDLIEINNNKFNQIHLDACNFTPEFFKFSNNDKNWDILYVARAVFFKKIPEFFKIIRELYDNKKYYRVLLICPIPDECKNKQKSPDVFCNVRQEYDNLFSEEEKKFFTLLTTDFNNPFPFDLKTLSFFYRASKIFVHSADNERRCRVVGYAHASGMPVVCLEDPASLLPRNLKTPPLVYIARNYEGFSSLINKAIQYVDSNSYNIDDMLPAIKECSETYSKERLKEIIDSFLSVKTSLDEYNFNDLDIRLGRHHGLGNHKNSCGWSIPSLVNYLQNHTLEEMNLDIKNEDPEKYILKYLKYGIVSKKKYVRLNRHFFKKLILQYFPFIKYIKSQFKKNE
jgi:hypothetical protein